MPSAVAGLYGHRPELVEVISEVALKTLPGESALGSALRDERVWPGGLQFIGMPLAEAVRRGLSLGFNRFALELAAEEVARRQGSPRVGERHIAVVLLQDKGDYSARMSLDPARLIDAVRELELGAAFDPARVQGAVAWIGGCQYRDPVQEP